MCHGEFLNADSTYVHKNESFKGFGSYGDILVRDRKMYVAPTPFALVEGTVHQRTLIVPAAQAIDGPFVRVGELMRREADQIVAAYQFDLRRNEISTATVPNPNAGRIHAFSVHRLRGDPTEPVSMQALEWANLKT